MEIVQNIPQPGLVQVEPVLIVRDVLETLRYWKDVLSFPHTWQWGEPVVHGGASWHGVQVQFAQRDQPFAPNNPVWFRVREVEQLYALHQSLGADIVSPLELQSWGMGQYTVRELNGYHLHFAAPMRENAKQSKELPDKLRVITRPPTVTELSALATAVGWSVTHTPATYAVMMDSLVAGVVAEAMTTGEIVGCALLTGNAGSMYYVRDVVVHPDWQGKHVGSALMDALLKRADVLLPENTMITLITSEHMAPFYRQFDFTPVFSMMRNAGRKETSKDL